MPKPVICATKFMRRLIRLRAISTLISLAGALGSSQGFSLLEQIQHQGTLEFLSSNGPDTIYEGAEGLAGFEYELIKRFSTRLGVQPVITQFEDTHAILYALQSKPRAIAAAGIVATPSRVAQAAFGPAYLEARSVVIGRIGSKPITSVAELVGRDILVKQGSPQAEFLHDQQKTLADLHWQEADVDMQDLQERVHSGKAEIALLDRATYEQNKALYTNAQIDFEIQAQAHIAWAFAPQKDPSLRDAANTFFGEITASGELAQLRDNFTDDPIEPDEDITAFNHDTEERLRRWEAPLKQAAEENDLDWRTLAAIGYQESHWNAQATSETGVRGFMMLTNAAAKEMNVHNRLDAKQSIQGGAKLLRFLLDKLPTEMPAEDKLPMALTAYNLGSGHLDDARGLAKKMGKNANRWSDVKAVLPLLGRPSVYRNLRHGYARGAGAVHYADTITTNTALLALREQETERMLLADEIKPSVSHNADISPLITNALRNLTVASAL